MFSADSPNSSFGHDLKDRRLQSGCSQVLTRYWRVLRNGKNYTEFVDDAFIVRGFHHDADSDGGAPGDSDLEDEVDLAPAPSRSSTPASSAPTVTPPSIPPPRANPARRKCEIIRLARQSWETTNLAPPAPPASLVDKEAARKHKKKQQHHQARKVKREALRVLPGGTRAPKAVTEKHARQSSPISIDFHFSTHPAIASTGWMGLRDAPTLEFEPEAWEYSLEEALEIPGMILLDWQGKPTPLVDADRYVFAVLGGQPRDPDWQKNVVDPASDLMQEAAAHVYDRTFHGIYYGTRKQEKKACEAMPNRRGPHHAESFGPPMDPTKPL
ncbi:hypothetical protein K438DRAFT_1997694 [Mycena galopus ATCC 62051]|nr:hypothetical protein K438DRAFT_1997694 [Mycena galopus ATCC 62051]